MVDRLHFDNLDRPRAEVSHDLLHNPTPVAAGLREHAAYVRNRRLHVTCGLPAAGGAVRARVDRRVKCIAHLAHFCAESGSLEKRNKDVLHLGLGGGGGRSHSRLCDLYVTHKYVTAALECNKARDGNDTGKKRQPKLRRRAHLNIALLCHGCVALTLSLVEERCRQSKHTVQFCELVQVARKRELVCAELLKGRLVLSKAQLKVAQFGCLGIRRLRILLGINLGHRNIYAVHLILKVPQLPLELLTAANLMHKLPLELARLGIEILKLNEADGTKLANSVVCRISAEEELRICHLLRPEERPHFRVWQWLPNGQGSTNSGVFLEYPMYSALI
eukprot:Opistho-2@31449